ncbi:hypothetical protein A5906_25815 [Bradyrhizobium sacchari]|uniref:Uncharacterized protein n=1 Tax=Bradyrhizobium sacchari TaxID=1399419 RepID=A0A560JYI6_9BRAD|nr:hypothetical protein [Bradyrhizobium sacchari]OPY99159.1 hypothetical protein A5906_25815 [Bradyrhizobium sacchari]TWB63044.1 hypothetical protein FBZ94_103744 [Bradyrhizobium sacchari]TWB76026.1 hypothetical protein FBZ95_104206 [Bradyrhizobium sacchari]
MPNSATETTAARSAVTFLYPPVNVIEKLLKHISGRADEIADCIVAACGSAQDDLLALETIDLGDELNVRRKSLEDQLLQIEIAAHDLDELVGFVGKLASE